MIDCNNIAANRYSCYTCIAGCCRNNTITGTCDCNSIGQFIGVQCHFGLIQRQTASSFTNRPAYFFCSSRIITPAVVSFWRKCRLICTSICLCCHTQSQLCRVIVTKCRRFCCTVISKRTTLTWNSSNLCLIWCRSNPLSRTPL